MDIDWHKLHAGLQKTRGIIENQVHVSEEKAAQVLKLRAEKLARQPAPAYGPDEYIDVLEFQLGHENYAIDIPFVMEVRQMPALTPLPGTPAFVPGIINIRGRIFSIVDLKIVFGLPKGMNNPGKVIILDHEGMAFGILADGINGVRRILNGDIQKSLPVTAATRQEYFQEYFKGITQEQLILLDASRLLTDKTMLINQEL